MSDQPAYDLSKNITDIQINPGFILGLDNVLVRYITDVYEDTANLVDLFKKFGKVLSGDLKPEELKLNQVESEIYTIFFLQQLLKSYALKQGLISESTKPDADLMKQMLEPLVENSEKLDKITQLVNDLIDQQDD